MFGDVLWNCSISSRQTIQKNQDDEDIKNELPTIDELFQLYEDGLMTEPMLIKATAFLTEDAQDGMTDSELFWHTG